MIRPGIGRSAAVALTLAAAMPGLAGAAPVARPGPAGGEILWDRYGVPHIYAKSEAGGFYGFGYAQAQSHGDLLIHLYGDSRGRAAEYWGAAFAGQDRWLIANDVPERARVWYRAQTARMRANVDAFAAGINAYAAAHRDRLDPAVLRVLPVTGLDVIAHAHRLMNYVYIAPERKVLATPAADEAGGSNAWAVAPSRSASGAAMLLANPHLAWAPSQLTYYEAQITTPGFSLYGATQVGLPVLRFGFNRDLGFTNTVNTIAGSTSYVLTPAGGGYRFDGRIRPFRVERKRFKVRQPDGSFRLVRFDQRFAVQGPVFDLPDGKTIIALKVAGLDRPGALEQYLDMGKARDLAGFQAALRRLQVPMFNIVYADRAGHILYLDNGILPRHAGGSFARWSSLVAGDTSATLWHDVHEYDDLPKTIDPVGGFVQNANDPPWVSAWPRLLDPAAFPAYVAPVGPMSQRAQMSVKLLDRTPKIGFDDFVARKLTTRSLMADRLLPALIAAAKDSGDADVRLAAGLLAGWDRQFDADSRGALLFETWAGLFAGADFAGEANYAVKWSLADPLETPRGIGDPAAAVALLKQAVGRTKLLYGAVDRPFGAVSRFHLGAVNLPGNGGFGNLGVFRTITWGPMTGGERIPLHGETWVSMVEFGTPMKAVGVMSYGNSSQPGSPHNSDQLEFLSSKTFRTLWIDRASVERNLEETTPF